MTIRQKNKTYSQTDPNIQKCDHKNDGQRESIVIYMADRTATAREKKHYMEETEPMSASHRVCAEEGQCRNLKETKQK
jgi:hypothetical protein